MTQPRPWPLWYLEGIADALGVTVEGAVRHIEAREELEARCEELEARIGRTLAGDYS